MSTSKQHFDPETAWAVGTGKYSDIVGPEAAAQYFDEVEACQMHNVERALRRGPRPPRHPWEHRVTESVIDSYLDSSDDFPDDVA